MNPNIKKYQNFAAFMVFYTLLVILWGAWVRISHSGDGCGQSWPLCHGELIPQAANQKTWTEYFHRFMSGLYGILVIVQFFWSKKCFKSSTHYFWAKWTLIFMITEALLGAKLVLFGLVGSNSSFWRLFVMALHFLNSLMLTLGVYSQYFVSQKIDLKKSQNSLSQNFIYLGIFFIIGASGTFAALANTLFPAEDILSSLLKEFNTDSHLLLKLRSLHPLIAVVFGGGLFYYFFNVTLQHKRTALMILSTLIIGAITLLSLSPTWLKISHLLFAHLTWLFLVNLMLIQKYKQHL